MKIKSFVGKTEWNKHFYNKISNIDVAADQSKELLRQLRVTDEMKKIYKYLSLEKQKQFLKEYETLITKHINTLKK